MPGNIVVWKSEGNRLMQVKGKVFFQYITCEGIAKPLPIYGIKVKKNTSDRKSFLFKTLSV